MKLLLLILSFVALSSCRLEHFTTTKIDRALLKKPADRDANDTFPIFVTSTTGIRNVLSAIEDTRFDTIDDLRTALRRNLIQNADTTMVGLKQYLDDQQKRFTSIWITNQIYIPDANCDDLIAIDQMDDVLSVDPESILSLDDPMAESDVIFGRANTEAEWGIKKIQAEEAHELLKNITVTAAPIRIATIDTGVRYTHEALRDNYLGPHGWYDPYEWSLLPNDNNGHGTHTTGTICGKGGIGVYPDAKWLACKGCATASCFQLALLACAQYILCPTLPDGTNPDCSKTPHVVSNSWGGSTGGNNWFDDFIAAWHTAKIIPIFSQGNGGPRCGSASSPGDRDVIGVGSTTIDDAISTFSSVGPTTDGRMKPEISAPGSNVLSAYHEADNSYRSLSGTSMACPHAAGLTAYLKAFNPNLEYKDVVSFMKGGVDTEPLQSSNQTCGGIPDNQFPNHIFGHGRINALKSLKALVDERNP